jgi:mono/diheme cytochrome c family protein
VNNQVVPEKIESKVKFHEVILIVITIFLITFLVIWGYSYVQKNDPYIQEVLSLQGDQNRGEAIFQVNCAVCHGINGDGHVGPSLHDILQHKSQVKIINQVTRGETPPMPKFQPSSQEMADLLRYLENL